MLTNLPVSYDLCVSVPILCLIYQEKVVIVCSSNFNQCVSVCVGLPDVSKHPPGILAVIIVMLHSYKTTSLPARSQGWCQCVVPIHASLPALYKRSAAAADWRWRYRYLVLCSVQPGSGQPPRPLRHTSIAAILAKENMVQIFSLVCKSNFIMCNTYEPIKSLTSSKYLFKS